MRAFARRSAHRTGGKGGRLKRFPAASCKCRRLADVLTARAICDQQEIAQDTADASRKLGRVDARAACEPERSEVVLDHLGAAGAQAKLYFAVPRPWAWPSTVKIAADRARTPPVLSSVACAVEGQVVESFRRTRDHATLTTKSCALPGCCAAASIAGAKLVSAAARLRRRVSAQPVMAARPSRRRRASRRAALANCMILLRDG